MPMTSASAAVCTSARRNAPALNPAMLSARTNLKRSPSVRQCSSIGSQRPGSGVLLITTIHFVILIIEPRDGIERLFEHLRWLVVSRNVDGDFGRCRFGYKRRSRYKPERFAPKSNGGDLFHTRECNHDQRYEEYDS